MTPKPIEYAVLVYQAGLANLFAVDCLNASPFGRNAIRLCQSDFGTCEAMARGIAACGVPVASMWCNKAGDIANSKWNHHDLSDAPFSDKFHPVFSKVANPDSLTVQVGEQVAYLF